MGLGLQCDFFRWTRGQDLSAGFPPVGSEVDDVIGALDDIEVVFDDKHCISLVDQPLKQLDQLAHIRQVESRGGFIEKVEGPSGGSLGEFSRELDTLGFSAGQSGGGLPNAQIAESYITKGLKGSAYGRDVFHEGEPFFHRHFQDIRNGASFVPDLKGLPVVASGFTDLARNEEVRQEVHFDPKPTGSFAGLATSTGNVE